jgi:SAM-dependent methyltransferase
MEAGGNQLMAMRELVVDLGCGTSPEHQMGKLPGSIGVDAVSGPGVDIVVDLDSAPLPFEDDSVRLLYSSHCLEHLKNDPLQILREISRVCRHGAQIEIWLPYGWHSDGMVLGHVRQYTEATFVAIGYSALDHWSDLLDCTWVLEDVVFVTSARTVLDLASHNVELPFAIRYYKDVVREFGVFFRIDKSGPEFRPDTTETPPRFWWSNSRLPEEREPLPGWLSSSTTGEAAQAARALIRTLRRTIQRRLGK